MFIDRAEHDLSSLSSSIKQEPMDTTDTTPQPPPTAPKPKSPPKQEQPVKQEAMPQSEQLQAFQLAIPQQAAPLSQLQPEPLQQQFVSQQQQQFFQVQQQGPIEEAQIQPQFKQQPAKAPMPGAVAVFPPGVMPGQQPQQKSPPKTMPKPATPVQQAPAGPGQPPRLLSELQGAEINEGDR